MSIVTLQKLETQDAERIAYIANDHRISDNLRDYFPYPYTLQDAKAFLALETAKKPRQNHGIYEDDRLVGICGVIPFDDIYRHSAEMGYWIGVAYWGRGIMSRALPQLIQYGFEAMNLHRIQAGVIASNTASIRVLEKCGMTKDGCLRDHVSKKEKFYDEHIYSILRDEYQHKLKT